MKIILINLITMLGLRSITRSFNRFSTSRRFIVNRMELSNSSRLLTAISDAKLMGVQLPHFPTVTVVGPQSSGKSSVIEALCGKDILPKAMKMSSMKPVNITLIKSKDPKITVGSREFKSDSEAAEEIKRLNENDYIQNIVVEIHSPDVYNCSLTDLPGLFVVADDVDIGLPKKIKQLTIKHLEDKNTIPVVVHAAPSDAATNQGINLVKKCGKGNQTFMVITKVDQALSGQTQRKASHLSRMLNGETYHLGLGAVAVTLRNDSDIEQGKTIEKKIEEEEQYFKKVGLAPSGVKTMRRMISEIQTERIKDQIPQLLKDIDAEIEKTNSSKSFMDDLIGNDQSKLASQLRVMIEKLVGSSSERAAFEDKLKDAFKLVIKKYIAELTDEEVNKSHNKKKLSDNYVDINILCANNACLAKSSDYEKDSIKEMFSYGLLSTIFLDNQTLQMSLRNEEKLALALPMIELFTNDPLGRNRVESNKMLNRCFNKLLVNDAIHKIIRDITEQGLLAYVQEDSDNCSELTKKFAEFMISAISDEAYESKIKYSITAMLNLEKRPQISIFEILRYIGQIYPDYFKSNGGGYMSTVLQPKRKLKIEVYGEEWNRAYLQVVGDKLTENSYRNVAVNLLDQMITKLLELCFDMFNKSNMEKQKKKTVERLNKLEEIKSILEGSIKNKRIVCEDVNGHAV